jgi:hypothetical protein
MAEYRKPTQDEIDAAIAEAESLAEDDVTVQRLLAVPAIRKVVWAALMAESHNIQKNYPQIMANAVQFNLDPLAIVVKLVERDAQIYLEQGYKAGGEYDIPS